MPVIKTPSVNGKIGVRPIRADRKNRYTGRDRKGFNAASGLQAMTDNGTAVIEQPTVEKPAALIKHLRVIGATKTGTEPEDVLTAQGHALYEMLMASARIQGIENTEFRVAFEDAKKFLRIEHNSRLISLADQLRETEVEYTFRLDGYERFGRMPLLLTDFCRDDAGKSHILYSIHNAVRRIILERHHYTKLEINAFPRFKCKYTARVYPKLAMIAGYDEAYRQWQIEPEKLAREIGFVFSGDFHFGNFEKGCLKKVMADIGAHIERFNAHCEIVRKPGRGNPVDHLFFTVEPTGIPLQEQRKVALTESDYEALNAALKRDENCWVAEMPSTELLRKAATVTGYSVHDLLRLWKDSLSQMHAYPTIPLRDAELLTGREVLDLFFAKGVGAAFSHWATYLRKKETKPEEQLSIPAPLRIEEGYRMYVLNPGGSKRPNSVGGKSDWDAIIEAVSSSDDAALTYCDPNLYEWQNASRKFVDDEDTEFCAALRTFAQVHIPGDARRNFITGLCRIFIKGDIFDTGKNVKAFCSKARAPYRVAVKPAT